MTGAGLEALNAAGFHDTEAQAKALAYLHEAQLPDGGWPQEIGEAKKNPTSARPPGSCRGSGRRAATPKPGSSSGNEPLGYMASLQQPDGHVRYMRSHDLNGVWMSAYAGPAFVGQPLPIPPAPRSQPPVSPPKEAGTASAQTGVDKKGENEGFQHGAGVTAAGGGDRAPLFSRPKPQSKGKTPGGARVVGRQQLRAKDHSHNRRGANQHQARGTEKVEPQISAEADQEATAVTPTSPAEANEVAAAAKARGRRRRRAAADQGRRDRGAGGRSRRGQRDRDRLA